MGDGQSEIRSNYKVKVALCEEIRTVKFPAKCYLFGRDLLHYGEGIV